eukprot:TRINITY_DN1729_c0_g2_i1.p1 TRINITY_DN1729_c0_g2~~TRINITY_DN1729_c0_g2_i1.p1  ORF type:complete len:706 (+),score=130.91 TRINITY_DN1729_c0_g2_i1:126-2243(+)
MHLVNMLSPRTSRSQMSENRLSCLSLLKETRAEDLVNAINQKDLEGNTPLHLACSQGIECSIVALLLEKGSDINLQNNFGNTALHIVCSLSNPAKVFNNEKLIQALLTAGAKTDVSNTNGDTPLHIAAKHGNVTSITLLLQKGADINVKGKGGTTPFHLIAKNILPQNLTKSFMHLLIQYGADNSVTDDEGKSATDYNVELKKLCTGIKNRLQIQLDKFAELARQKKWHRVTSILKLFTKDQLQKFINNTGKDTQRTALHYAANQGLIDIVKLLLQKGADVNASDRNGRRPIGYCYRKHHDVSQLLLKAGANIDYLEDGNTLLVNAVKRDSYNNVVKLLELGASPYVCDKHNKPLITLTNDKRILDLLKRRIDITKIKGLLHAVIKDRDSKLLQKYISQGADINEKDSEGKTPMHIAALCNNEDALRILVSKGAYLEEKDNTGKSPLIYGMMFGLNFLEVLLDIGASLDTKDNEGLTPLHHAAKSYSSEDLVQFLLQKNIDFNAKDNKQRSVFHFITKASLIPMLVNKGIDINARDLKGKTALHYSIVGIEKQLIDALITHGASVNIADLEGNTPLHVAVLKYSNFYGDFALKLLLSKGADCNAENNRGETPLFLAAVSSNENVLAMLLSTCPNINQKNSKGQTLLHQVIESHNNGKSVITLLSAGADPIVEYNGEKLDLAKLAKNKGIVNNMLKNSKNSKIVKY